MTTDTPWHALYDEGMPTKLGEPEHRDGLSIFRAACARAPERPLVIHGAAATTFRRFDELSDALAGALRDRSISAGDRVALYLQNGPQYVLGLLAVWKLHAVVVACNPMLRERELADELRDSGAVAILTYDYLYSDVLASVVPQSDLRVVITTSVGDFDGDGPPTADAGRRQRTHGTLDLADLLETHTEARPNVPDPCDPDDIAVLTYTSGTTGPAKGAMNTHRNFAFSSRVFREWFHVGDDDVICGIAPLFHVTGLVANIGLAFSAAVPMILTHRFDPDETCRLIEKYAATITVAPITAFLSIADAVPSSRYDLSSLTKAYTGGAPTPPGALERVALRHGLTLRTAYGLTETTSPTHLTPLGLRTPVDPASGVLAVGLPVFNTKVRILDEAGLPVPSGQVGEVAISGPQVVPGYWRRPEESAKVIRAGELLTGDVGKVDRDGWLYLIDRRKDLIVASGYKIWPREVEDVLYEHPAVREAAVVGVPDSYRGETVRAFVSLNQGASVSDGELVAFCRARLAAYKYPRTVDVLVDLPKTTSGKILRRTLRASV